MIDLIRDPRDMLASIRAFTSRGIDGFGRVAGQSEAEYLERYVEALHAEYVQMLNTPTTVDRVLISYEDCATRLADVASTLGQWLGVHLDADTVHGQRSQYAHHTTTPTMSASIGRWKRDLADAEAAHVARSLGPVLAELGYPLPNGG